jgi:hypothetical protein
MMRWWIALVLLFAFGIPAAAQSTYVGASLVGDLARFTKVDYDEDDVRRVLTGDASIDGDAIGFNVKIGRAITNRWGVEFEYARSGEFEHSFPQILPGLQTELPTGPGLPSFPVTWVSIPYFDVEVNAERKHTSVSALAFVRQDLGDDFELSFLGGVAFNRVDTEQNYSIDIRRLAMFAPLGGDVETIEYHVGPAVGAEAAFKIGEAAAITGGVRLHGATVNGRNGWLIRPNVGMRWSF